MTTNRGRVILALMQGAHERFPGEPCWLVDSHAGRYALLVPTERGYLRISPAINGRTLSDLHGSGLIVYGPDGTAPDALASVKRDSRTGCPVQLTEKGRQA